MRAIILLGLVVLLFSCDHVYERGDSDVFTIKVGESFSIRLPENGSTGASNCWLNENKCTSTKLSSRRYESSDREKAGYDGAGGTTTLTFEGVSIGVDTIKIRVCLTAILRKPCSFFQDSSYVLTEGSKKMLVGEPHKDWDYTFIVNVRE